MAENAKTIFKKREKEQTSIFLFHCTAGELFLFLFSGCGKKGGKVMSAAAAEFFFQCTHLGSPSCFAPGEQLYKKSLDFQCEKVGGGIVMSYNFRQFLSLTKTMKICLGTHISKVFLFNKTVLFSKCRVTHLYWIS